jgi:hypothetical protein
MLTRIQSLLLVTTIALSTVACSRRSLSVDDGSPPTFKLSGDYLARWFQVSRKEGDRIWLLYPRGNDVTLTGMRSIQYGVVPTCCYQEEPPGPPPVLEEGVTYVAAADVFDASSVWIEFTMKNGKAVVTSSSADQGY